MISSKHTQTTDLHVKLTNLNFAQVYSLLGGFHKIPFPSAFYLAIGSVLLLQSLCLYVVRQILLS